MSDNDSRRRTHEVAFGDGDEGSTGSNDDNIYDEDHQVGHEPGESAGGEDEDEVDDPTVEQLKFQDKMQETYERIVLQANRELADHVQANPVPDEGAASGTNDNAAARLGSVAQYVPACLEYHRVVNLASFRFQTSGRTGWIVGCGDNDMRSLGLKARGYRGGTSGLVLVNQNLCGAGIRQIACAGLSSAFLSDTGIVYTCGVSDNGGLGRDIPSNVTDVETWEERPRPLTNAPPRIRQIACGESHGLGLTAPDGLVYMWGMYRDGESTHYRPTESTTERSVGCNDYASLIPNLKNVLHVYTGQSANYSYALTDDGELFSWGFGNSGELARPILDANGRPYDSAARTLYEFVDEGGRKRIREDILRQFLIPNQVKLPFRGRAKVLSVACGSVSVLVVARDPETRHGRVYSAGANNYGQLGSGRTVTPDDAARDPTLEANRHELRPIQALENLNMSKVAAGEFHCLALTLDCKGLYAWGRSDQGQLGLGDDPRYTEDGASVPTPTRVEFYDRTSTLLVGDISCGSNHSMAKSLDGDVYTWGYTDGRDAMATGHRAPTGRDIYIPIKLDMVVEGVDEPMEAIQMEGGHKTSLFLVQRRNDEPE